MSTTTYWILISSNASSPQVDVSCQVCAGGPALTTIKAVFYGVQSFVSDMTDAVTLCRETRKICDTFTESPCRLGGRGPRLTKLHHCSHVQRVNQIWHNNGSDAPCRKRSRQNNANKGPATPDCGFPKFLLSQKSGPFFGRQFKFSFVLIISVTIEHASPQLRSHVIGKSVIIQIGKCLFCFLRRQAEFNSENKQNFRSSPYYPLPKFHTNHAVAMRPVGTQPAVLG